MREPCPAARIIAAVCAMVNLQFTVISGKNPAGGTR